MSISGWMISVSQSAVIIIDINNLNFLLLAERIKTENKKETERETRETEQ